MDYNIFNKIKYVVVFMMAINCLQCKKAIKVNDERDVVEVTRDFNRQTFVINSSYTLLKNSKKEDLNYDVICRLFYISLFDLFTLKDSGDLSVDQEKRFLYAIEKYSFFLVNHPNSTNFHEDSRKLFLDGGMGPQVAKQFEFHDQCFKRLRNMKRVKKRVTGKGSVREL